MIWSSILIPLVREDSLMRTLKDGHFWGDMCCPLAEMGWGLWDGGKYKKGSGAQERRRGCHVELPKRSPLPPQKHNTWHMEGDDSGRRCSCLLCHLSVLSAAVSSSSTLNACHFIRANTIPPVPELTDWIVATVKMVLLLSRCQHQE